MHNHKIITNSIFINPWLQKWLGARGGENVLLRVKQKGGVQKHVRALKCFFLLGGWGVCVANLNTSLWLKLNMYDFEWPYLAITPYDCIWLILTLFDSVWLCLTMTVFVIFFFFNMTILFNLTSKLGITKAETIIFDPWHMKSWTRKHNLV